jgi:DNA polymerase III epsilon subunit-like protein
MILFFDTETTGLPKNYKAPVTDLENWPRLVQLAYILQDYDGNTILKGDYIIKPNGFTIPSDSSEIHGISTDRAMIEGKELEIVLDEFNALIESAEYIVAHNISFDEKINGESFDLTKKKEFKGFWIQPGVIVTAKYFVNDDWQLSLGYNYSVGMNVSNSTEEKVTFNNQQIRFGIHFNIN